jgi:hypothetical protein
MFPMRRFLVVLALTLIVVIAVALGVIVASFPRWRHLVAGLS